MNVTLLKIDKNFKASDGIKAIQQNVLDIYDTEFVPNIGDFIYSGNTPYEVKFRIFNTLQSNGAILMVTEYYGQ